MSLDDVFNLSPGKTAKPPPEERHYPGSRPLRDIESLDKKSSDVEGDEDWDQNPMMLVGTNGIEMEFFRIAALAAALGRTPVTIRSWETKGWLPLSKYRTPNPRGGGVPGKVVKGQRLYTRQQIEVVMKAAKECGVMTKMGQQADWDKFVHTVFAGWKSVS